MHCVQLSCVTIIIVAELGYVWAMSRAHSMDLGVKIMFVMCARPLHVQW